MPFEAPHFSLSDSVNAGQQLVSPLQKALQKYEEDKRKTDFNQGAFDLMATQTGPDGQPYIKPEILEKWHRMNPDAQAGTLAGIGGQIKNDMEKAQLDRQNQLADAQATYYKAHADQASADAFQKWTGTGADASFEPSPEQHAAAKAVGKIWLPMGPKNGQWVEDPNNPVNMGQAPPTEIKDPRDPSKIIGLQDARGGIKYFPKPSTLQEAMDMGLIPKTNPPPPATPAASPAATPIAVNGYIPGRRYAGKTFKGGDPNDPANWQ